jgi:hypothetical protein
MMSVRCQNHHEIKLGEVSDLPEYFYETYHFGKDIKAIEKLNEFILVTGKIDTTSESPPLRLAVVVVGRDNIFLKLTKTKTDHELITEEYSGNGYKINLVYRQENIKNHSPIYEGYFVIEHGDTKSQYEVVGASRYF